MFVSPGGIFDKFKNWFNWAYFSRVLACPLSIEVTGCCRMGNINGENQWLGGLVQPLVMYYR